MAVESNTPAADLAITCFTCDPLQAYVDLTGNFVDKLADALQSPMLILFASFAGLWVVMSGVKLALKMTELKAIVIDFVLISITGVLLGSLGVSLISYVYTSAISIMGGSSAAVFALAANGAASGKTGLVGLAANGELAVVKVFQTAQAISRAGSTFDVTKYVYALVLVVPYFLLVVTYAGQVVVAIFRATMVGVFAPFLFMAFAFGWGRDMAKSGARTLFASVAVLFSSTAALSLAIYGVNQILKISPDQMTSDAIDQFASISNPKFLVILFLGWMGTALQTEGTSIANSIVHTLMTNAAAGILTAGSSATALTMLKLLGKGVKASGGWGNLASLPIKGIGGASHLIADQAANLVDKFKNVNKPGGGS